MLKKIPKNISPDLLKILSEMGHGDEIVIADGNYPGESNAKRLLRYDASGTTELLKNILELFPLDSYNPHQAYLMAVEKNDDYNPEIWEEYKEILGQSYESYSIKHLDRQTFYNKSKESFAIIATGEEKLYANIILKKGVVN